MKKLLSKSISIFLAFALLIGFAQYSPNVKADAANIDYGYCGSTLYWWMTDHGQLVINGQGGEMTEYLLNDQTPPWFKYSDSITEVRVDEGVTSLCYGAFAYCENLSKITLPSTLTAIGAFAFEGTQLFSDNYKDGTVYLNDCLIYADSSEITGKYEIKDGTRLIADMAFGGCAGMTDIVIPNTVQNIGAGAFIGSGLTSIDIHENLKKFNQASFFGCEKLERFNVNSANPNYCDVDGIVFSKDMKTIVGFPVNKAVTEYTIPESVTVIGDSAFAYCGNLTDITIPEGVTAVNIGAFEGAGIKSITLPTTVTDEIGDGAFYGCEGLEEAFLLCGANYLGDGVFAFCSNLKNIYISDRLSRIGESAFYGCDNLSDIYFSGSRNEWYSIFVDQDGNDVLHSAKLHLYYKPQIEDDETGVIVADDDIKNCTLTVTEKDVDSAPALEGKKVLNLYEITLKNSNGDDVQPKTPIILKFPYDSSLNKKITNVYKVESDGTLTLQKPAFEDGFIILETTNLGTYAIVNPLTRLWGFTRYDTAISISKYGWESADTVVLANGTNYADALAGVPLAYKLDAPILLTGNGPALEKNVAAQIEKLGASKVVILGGPGAVSGNISTALEEKYEVERVAGFNRYQTAVQISKQISENPETAIVVTGNGYADALSISPYSAIKGYPIVYSAAGSGLTSDTLKYLESAKDVIIIGGPGVVGTNVNEQLGDKNINRIAGFTKYQTSLLITQSFESEFNNDAMLATGTSFPDALAGGVLAAKLKTPLLLTEPPLINSSIYSYIANRHPKNLYLLGGPGIMPDVVAEDILTLHW